MMSRPRSGIGAELVPLILILAGLAGSLAIIITVHRRATSPRPTKPAVAVALPPSLPAPQPKPAPLPSPVVAEPEAGEPEPPPPPPPEDPTPKAIAKLTSAEAEQLLEASRADRKAAALEEARKAALLESEKWRRRESLVRLQLNSLDAKVRKLETEVDEMALERDALEKELDARKAMASKVRSRPNQAILPHRGQNGTWRRPIVIECSNGMATLQPQGVSFGLFELASGFGPASNPFVAAVAREAIRIQGNHSPDGMQVVPYIFFLVRPDGIRPYYEARGRLEPLGITFGYELADLDWQIDFPDLDDVQTWDGSPSSRPDPLDVLPRSPSGLPGASPAEDEDFPTWASSGRTGSTVRDDGPGSEFVWPPKPRTTPGRSSQPSLPPSIGQSGPRSPIRYGNASDNRQAVPSYGSDGVDPSVGQPSGAPGVGIGTGTGSGGGLGDPLSSAAPRELSLGGGPIMPLGPASPPSTGRPSGTSATLPPDLPSGDGETSEPSKPQNDPANSFVWPSKPAAVPSGKPADRSGQPVGDGGFPSVDQTPPVRHVGPFSRPLAMGLDSMVAPGTPDSSSNLVEVDPSQPDGAASGSPVANARPSQGGSSAGSTRGQGATGSASSVQGIGQGGSPSVQPPPGTIGVGTPDMSADGTPPPGMTPPTDMTPPSGQPKKPASTPSLPDLPPPAIVDRRFEIVLVCGPRGVIVQPGAYRVTTDALKDQDGLLKKQIVALVKARRTADPKTIIEPRVRFLIQPGGEQNYWTAKGQFLMSGLDWPTSTRVADPDHLIILPSESW